MIRVYALAAAATIWALSPVTAQERGQGRGAKPDPRDLKVLAPEDVPQELGVPGSEVPDAKTPSRVWPVIHLDTAGSSAQSLADLQGAGEHGFVVLWSDGRAGAPTHFFRHLPRQLEPGLELEPEQRVAESFSGNSESQGAVALLGERALFTWRTSRSGPGRFEVRGLGPGGLGPSSLLSPPPAHAGRSAGDLGRAPAGPDPDPVVLPEGGAVAWTHSGRVILQRLDGAFAPRGEPSVLHEGPPMATRVPTLRVRSDGAFACAWNAGPLLYLMGHLADDSPWWAQPCSGALLDWAADPAGPGYWLCLRRGGQVLLQRISAKGELLGDPRQIPIQPSARLELASGREGLGLVFEQAAEPPSDDEATEAVVASDEPQLLWLDPLGTPLGDAAKLPGCAPGALGARIAEADGAWLAAWDKGESAGGGIALTWLRHGAHESDQRLDLARNEASANQDLGVVASADERGCLGWVDARSGPPRVFVRSVALDTGELGREVALPAGTDAVEAGYQVAVTLHPDGRTLCAWVGAGARGPTLYTQAFDRALAPLSERSALDPDHIASVLFPPALATLRGESGHVVAWVRDIEGTTEPSLWVQRVSLLGRPQGSARRVAEGLIKDPALCRLDDGRVLLAWDALVLGIGSRLRAQFLDELCEPSGRELRFDTMFREWDRRPAVAPGPDGGFALAWCAGSDDERDVFYRSFDASGRPAGRPLALTTRAGAQDSPTLARLPGAAGHAVAWVDDLGAGDRVRLVRIHPRTGPGRTVRLGGGDLTATYQVSPWLAPRPAGLALVWTHNGRGLGRDVGLCFLEADFDQIPTPLK